MNKPGSTCLLMHMSVVDKSGCSFLLKHVLLFIKVRMNGSGMGLNEVTRQCLPA
jgi:hypothetical protein